MITPVIYRRESDVEGAPEFIGRLHEPGNDFPIVFKANSAEAIQTKMDEWIAKQIGDQKARDARIEAAKAARAERKSKGAA